MDLDSWLRTTNGLLGDPTHFQFFEDKDGNKLPNALKDSWAEGNTDGAFKVNDFVGVQRSHRGNDWNSFGGDLVLVDKATFNILGEAAEPVVMNSSKPDVEINTIDTIDNTQGKSDITKKYTNTVGTVTTSSTSFEEKSTINVDSGFEFKGISFKISGSRESQQTDSTSKEIRVENAEETTVIVKPGEKSTISMVTTTQSTTFKLVLPVSITGWIGKASSNQNNWDWFIPIDKVVDPKRLQSKIVVLPTVAQKKTEMVVKNK